ncbi:uncharacterized protein PFL1_02629 [Pseudozyma flocculosa PF-1]|uniref:Uncharacterized protein n=1 Tax=Pseudozyma flocculosa PF-1 TaxID=1277687 RepID=A0A061HAM0_9BASI|nr:uncharacterized protein PFL1_02629 [Pseudozyma flocculosa PF-1]EPQ29957.1 hypothetical protein PFL1_02629 [Pseudozyma flocculosa PF-1]
MTTEPSFADARLSAVEARLDEVQGVVAQLQHYIRSDPAPATASEPSPSSSSSSSTLSLAPRPQPRPQQGQGQGQELSHDDCPSTAARQDTPSRTDAATAIANNTPSQLTDIFPWLSVSTIARIPRGAFRPVLLPTLADPLNTLVNKAELLRYLDDAPRSDDDDEYDYDTDDAVHVHLDWKHDRSAALARSLPTPAAFAYCWTLFTTIAAHSSRDPLLGAALASHQLRILKHSATYEWKAVMHYHLAFHCRYAADLSSQVWSKDDVGLRDRILVRSVARTASRRNGIF